MQSSLRRLDGVAKVTGRLKFSSDMVLPSMLYAVPVLSTEAHARILSVDASEALKLPGCVKVYTGRDVPCNRVGYLHDHPVICDDKVRFYGDIVAVVAAETEEIARRAARLVRVAYEPLPLIETVEQALSLERGKVHDQMENNICHQIHYARGDVDAAFSKCKYIVENEYTFQQVDHCFLETECGVSSLEDGKLVIRSGSQNVYYDRGQIAEGLGLPEEQVVVIAPYTGGGFGGKGDISVQCLIGLVTLDTGRPCKMHFSREERFINGVKRHPGKVRMKTGADENGVIQAHEVYAVLDGGAYTVFGNVVLEIATECCAGPYRFPNIRVDTYNVYTNNGVNGAFRGFGAAQGCFPLEGQMNALARRMGMDAIELRIRNCLRQGERQGLGHILLSDTRMYETLCEASRDPLWTGRAAYRSSRGGVRTGVGVAAGMKGYSVGINGAPDFSFAQGVATRDGRFCLSVACIEMGQGCFTAMAEMFAETLKIPPERVELMDLCNSELNEETGATASSRVTHAVGLAVTAAGNELVAALRETAARAHGVPEDALQHVQGGFLLKGRLIPFASIAAGCPADIVRRTRVRTKYSDQPSEGALGHPHVLYSSNVQLALVEVDTATGMAHVDRMHVYVDVGRCMNRQQVEGQSEGGVVMGASYALLEKVERRAGRPLNPSFSSYVLPTALDAPPVIENHILEYPEPAHPFGVKGMGENATTPTAPAIVDAVNDALGTHFTELPLSPELLAAETNPWKGPPADGRPV